MVNTASSVGVTRAKPPGSFTRQHNSSSIIGVKIKHTRRAFVVVVVVDHHFYFPAQLEEASNTSNRSGPSLQPFDDLDLSWQIQQ